MKIFLFIISRQGNLRLLISAKSAKLSLYFYMAEFNIRAFLDLAEKYPIIDVRSPSEHNHGHIPLSVNIPLFDDEERAVIGTSYKTKGKKEAIFEGLEIVGPKIASFVRRAGELAVDNQVLVHCWRGGMRSGSFSWLINTAGIKSYTLKGGYKSYRKFALDFFSNLNNLILLGGETGSGKTEILQGLAKSGEQIIDLEALARHRGSSFGGLGGTNQPSNEQFQNNLLREMMKLDLSKRIFLEDESHNIGGVRIPDVLWFKMRASPVIRLVISKEQRINRLVKDYGKLDKELLFNSILRISRKLGGLHTTQALEYLEKDNFQAVADICLHYYDKAYLTGLKHRHNELINNFEAGSSYNQTSLVLKLKEFANIISSGKIKEHQ